MVCAYCGAEQPEGQRFCGECGRVLAGRAEPLLTAKERTRGTRDAQMRHGITQIMAGLFLIVFGIFALIVVLALVIGVAGVIFH